MLFINTRPIQRATSLNNFLHAYLPRLNLFFLPLLELIPLTLTTADTDYLHQLSLGYYDVLVVVSPTSAELGTHIISNLPHTIKVIAVGNVTADVLYQQDVTAIKPLSSSNEGMLQLPIIQQLTKGNRVLIWRGQGGRELLINTLISRQVQVDIVEFYQRILPTQSLTKYQNYFNTLNNAESFFQQRKVVLISSEKTFRHWQDLLVNAHFNAFTAPILTDFYYITLGQRITQILQGYDLKVYQIDDLKNDTIAQAIMSLS